MANKTLVIVESPTKARTIAKFLGSGYDILASYGHIRDLPNNAGEIPPEIKKEKWSRLGVNVDQNFEPLYIIPPKKKENLGNIKKALKDAKELLLATDEDREGESISWHLLEALKPKVPYKRLVFHEITKEAIQAALKNTRELDENLVKAQETRRIVDRLYGYSVSPVLWKKMAPRLSAGRVQSVAIRLLVERERERIGFHKAIYWDLLAKFQKAGDPIQFESALTQLGVKKVAGSKDFDAATGKLEAGSEVIILGKDEAEALHARLLKGGARVTSVEEKPYTARPMPPFTTSTLQQEASYKLRFPVRHTMSVAQSLYENGFITYMRTDSTTLSEEGLQGARASIESEFGKNFLHPEPRLYKTKVKNAQEAHEAIRPAGTDFASMNSVREKLGQDAGKLYELIWKRTLASQMKDATGTRITVQIAATDSKYGEALFRATGKTIEFPGYLRAYVQGSEDPEAELEDQEKVLPKLAQGDALTFTELKALEHETQPPSRYTEGSLIKELERRGIGRPSTWATVVDVVLSRDYAFKKGTALVPTFMAYAVTNLMEAYFTNLLDYEFTARLEDDLDAISRGEADPLKYLKAFYFGNGTPGLKATVADCEEKIDPRIVCGIPLGTDSTGRAVEVRIGRFGPFLSNGEQRASLPDTIAPDEMNAIEAERLLAIAAKGPESLGDDPVTQKKVYLKNGRFGPYVQLGEMVEGEDKPRMASLLPGMTPDSVDLETALKLLSLPRVVGKHPELNEDVVAANGRFGPYVKCGTETRSLPADGPNPLTVTLEEAVDLLKQPKGRRGQARAQPKKLKELGSPQGSTKVLSILNGRYGPYVTDGEVNASLPRGVSPEDLTIDQAVSLLEARALKIAEGGGKPRRGAKKKAAPKKAAAAKPEEPVKVEAPKKVIRRRKA
jgi:DNA topoisomerase-1